MIGKGEFDHLYDLETPGDLRENKEEKEISRQGWKILRTQRDTKGFVTQELKTPTGIFLEKIDPNGQVVSFTRISNF